MSKTISIHRKLTDFHNKENINNSSNVQYKNNINNHKYNKRSPEDSSLHLNSNLANKLLAKINDNNYANNLFNETDNSRLFKEDNPNINTNININIPNGIINSNDLLNIKINNNPKFISINDIIGEKCDLNLEILRLFFNNFDQSKTSRKNMGVVKSYGVNTYQGIVRNYNEDRVSIIINMNKPKDYIKGRWPKISFFGIYDGHGGEGCSEYLRDNLHKLICNNEYFPENVSEAIKLGISKAEQDFLNNYALSQNKEEIIDKSGSCAIIIILVDTNIYIANVGDSRCLLSMNNGNEYIEVTKDHKPNSPNEIVRIKKNGGNIYQSQTVINNTDNVELNGKILIGPYRVLPGRLSVSRTIGDAEAKIVKFGGNPNVIICEPEIFIYDLKKEDIDFFILGCDGIYDQMSNKEILDCAWMVLNEKENVLIKECTNIHSQSGLIVDLILKSSLARKSFDNVTCLFIALKNLGIKEIEQNDISKDKINKNIGDISVDSITPQKINPITPNETSDDTSTDQNKKNNFEKIYTIKRKSNVVSKQISNDYNSDDKKCRTNRNDNRYQLLNDNRIMNNNNIFNTDYKLSSLKLNNDIDNNQKELINYQNLSMKDFGADKNNNPNFHKIQAKQNSHKENKEEHTNNKLSHSKYQTANLMAYSKKNQSFTKINKYLITINNNNTNSKPIKKTINFDNYQTYGNKKVSEGNLNKKKIIDINNTNNNSNNSHIFKPISKFNLNSHPLKAIELKHSSTSSTKNLHLTSKNTSLFGNTNKFNKNEKKSRHGHTKSHRYLMANKENRNTTFFNNNSTFNINNKINNTQNEILINDKLKQKFINLNEQYKYQSQIMNNSNINNANLSGISNQNINININQRKPKKHLSLNNPGNSSMTLNNNYIINKNINNVYTSRMKRDLTSKIRQISMQKSLTNNNNFRLNHQINGMNSKHNLSMQISQLNNKINNYNYGDKIQKLKTYKYNNISKNYQKSTYNPIIKKNSEYNFAKKYNNKYLITDLGITKKENLYENNKKNIPF